MQYDQKICINYKINAERQRKELQHKENKFQEAMTDKGQTDEKASLQIQATQPNISKVEEHQLTQIYVRCTKITVNGKKEYPEEKGHYFFVLKRMSVPMLMRQTEEKKCFPTARITHNKKNAS